MKPRLRYAILFAMPSVLIATVAWAASDNVPVPKSLGEKIYLQQCAACHGLTGAADGPALNNLKLVAPSFKGMPQSDVEKLLTGTGKSSATHGQYKELTEPERQELIHYVGTLINN